MAKRTPAPTAQLDQQSPRRPGAALVLIVALALVAGFFVGMYNRQALGFIAPVFGLKVYSGQLDDSQLQTVYQDLKANYNGTLSDSKLLDGAIHGLVSAAGDQYTIYMNAQEAASFNDDLDGNVGAGIGVAVSERSNQPTIIQILPGNPATNSGLEVGDVITAVNGKSTNGQSIDDIVAEIKGQAGTTVKITIQRADGSHDYTLKRAVINNPSVTSEVKNGVGILTISRFDEQTGDLATTAAQSFKKQGVKAVILDLRGNGGGYLQAAQQVAGLWLNDQVVVSERTNGKVVQTLSTGDDAILNGIPTAVLVNSASASASEIVTGALQDHKAATIVGTTTFGKGSVQQVLSLTGGAQLKVTIANWYTPDGKNISGQGIKPNVSVDLTQDEINAGTDPQMAAALKAVGQ